MELWIVLQILVMCLVIAEGIAIRVSSTETQKTLEEFREYLAGHRNFVEHTLAELKDKIPHHIEPPLDAKALAEELLNVDISEPIAKHTANLHLHKLAREKLKKAREAALRPDPLDEDTLRDTADSWMKNP